MFADRAPKRQSYRASRDGSFQTTCAGADVFSSRALALSFLTGRRLCPEARRRTKKRRRSWRPSAKPTFFDRPPGLDPAQNKLILESASKPLFLVVQQPAER